MADEENSDANKVPFTLALIAGGCAGTTVDVALYPLDTLRTRMQACGLLRTMPSRALAPRMHHRLTRPTTTRNRRRRASSRPAASAASTMA